MATGYLRSAGTRTSAFPNAFAVLRTLSVAPISISSAVISSGRLILTTSSNVLKTTDASTISNYTINSPVGSVTPTITDIIVGTNTVSLGLSTDLLSGGSYSVSVAASTLRDSVTGAGNNLSTLNFTGVGTGPTIVSCISTATNLIKITFNKPIDTSTTVIGNISIPSLSIIFVYVLDNQNIEIVTSNQLNNNNYILTINNLKDLSGNISSPSISFTGIGTSYTIQTQFLNTTSIKVIFSRSMNITSLASVSNYQIDNGATINSVTVIDNQTVILNTSPLSPIPYHITVN